MDARGCLRVIALTLVAGCGGGGEGGAGDVVPDLRLDLVVVGSDRFAGEPVPILVSVLRDGSLARDYRGSVTFTTDDPAAFLPSVYAFTSADSGERLFLGPFIFSRGTHSLIAAAEGMEGSAEVSIEVRPNPNPPPLPPAPPATEPRYFYRFDPPIAVTGWSNNQDIAAADVDGDGDVDVVLAGLEYNSLWINDGQGSFAMSSQVLGTGVGRSAAFADVDGDGDADLVFAYWDGAFRSTVLWRNDGTGTFAQGAKIDESVHVLLRDLDGDGDPDLVLGRPNAVIARANDGTGDFSRVLQEIALTHAHQRPGLADLDRDGDLDLVADRKVYRNDGRGSFHEIQSLDGNEDSRAVAFGDMDGDGDLDLVAGNFMASSVLHLNDGTGALTRSPSLVTTPLCTVAIAVVDIDGDGDLDVLEGNVSDYNYVYLNEDTSFVPLDERMETFFEQWFKGGVAFALGDLDGDGDDDIVNASQLGPVHWFRNE